MDNSTSGLSLNESDRSSEGGNRLSPESPRLKQKIKEELAYEVQRKANEEVGRERREGSQRKPSESSQIKYGVNHTVS